MYFFSKFDFFIPFYKTTCELLRKLLLPFPPPFTTTSVRHPYFAPLCDGISLLNPVCLKAA